MEDVVIVKFTSHRPERLNLKKFLETIISNSMEFNSYDWNGIDFEFVEEKK